MTPRSDIALCSVGPKSCTHHAHCLRAQLPAHPARQAYCTPNRRGDECIYFSPIEAYTLTPAGSDAAESEPRTNAEAGGVQFGAGRSSSPANNIGTGHAAGSTLAPAPTISAAIRVAADGVHGAGGVLPSSAAGIPDYNDALRLHAARIIFGRS